MPAMDERTVERLVEVICDLGGPYERRGYELEAFVRRAGWVEPAPIRRLSSGCLAAGRATRTATP